jgi:hypothetical protein
MKNAIQIAKECGVPVDLIYRINNNQHISRSTDRGKYVYDKKQEEEIHKVLYFTGKATFLTLESKINYYGLFTQEEAMDLLGLSYGKFRKKVRNKEVKEEQKGYFKLFDYEHTHITNIATK